MEKNETREEFYTRSLKEHGYICPANKFDQPNFSKMTFADACNAGWCPYYNSICRHFGGKRKSISERRKLAVELGSRSASRSCLDRRTEWS